MVLAGDGSEIQYLRGTELAYQLHRLVEKGLKVTVVLDCLAAGMTEDDAPPAPPALCAAPDGGRAPRLERLFRELTARSTADV